MSKEKLVPVGPRLLIQPVVDEGEQQLGGIIIPDAVRNEKVNKSTVVAVGEGYRNEKGENIALSIQVGDVVITSKMSGTEVKFDGNTYYLVTEEEILGRVVKQ